MAAIAVCLTQQPSGRNAEAFGQRDQFVICDVTLAAFYLGYHGAANRGAFIFQAVRKLPLRKMQARALTRLSYPRSDDVLIRGLRRLFHL